MKTTHYVCSECGYTASYTPTIWNFWRKPPEFKCPVCASAKALDRNWVPCIKCQCRDECETRQYRYGCSLGVL